MVFYDITFTETVFINCNGQVKGGAAKVKIPDPVDLRLDYTVDLEYGSLTVSSVNTGVPHVVVMKDSVEEVDVFGLGREIRYHEAFAPAGTNVNFICQQKPGQLAIRTYTSKFCGLLVLK